MSHHAESHDQPDAHDVAHVKAHVRTHLILGLVLMVLSSITVLIAINPFSVVGNIIAAFVISAIEASIVAFCFMELQKARRLVLKTAVLTLVFSLAMIILNLVGFFDHIHGTLVWP